MDLRSELIVSGFCPRRIVKLLSPSTQAPNFRTHTPVAPGERAKQCVVAQVVAPEVPRLNVVASECRLNYVCFRNGQLASIAANRRDWRSVKHQGASLKHLGRVRGYQVRIMHLSIPTRSALSKPHVEMAKILYADCGSRIMRCGS
jgi:hypothetical protein